MSTEAAAVPAPGKFKRRNYGSGHAYWLDDRKVPGVTKILGTGIPKGGLIDWAGRSVAEYVMDRIAVDDHGRIRAEALIEDLRSGSKYPIPAISGRTVPRTKLAGELSYAHNRDRDAQALKGQQVHDIAKQLAETGEWTPGEDETHLEGYADALVDWWHRWTPGAVEVGTPVLVERSVLNRTIFYAGTFDLVAGLRAPTIEGAEGRTEAQPAGNVVAFCQVCGRTTCRGRALVDYKAGRSGIYGETALQLAAYRYAEVYVDRDGDEHAMPPIDHCLGVWLRADGTWETYPFRAGPAELRLFRYAYEIARFLDEPDLFKIDGDKPVMTVKGAPIQPREDVAG